LDENVPSKLGTLFQDEFEVTLIHDTPWAGLKNGELFRQISGNIDVLLTCDSNLQYQQNLRSLAFGIVVLGGRSNRIDDLLPLVPEARRVVMAIEPGAVIRVDRTTRSDS
jgi:hypothetical protein